MAKVFRVYGYVISPESDELNGTKDDLIEKLIKVEPTYPSWWRGVMVDEVDLGEWTDDHPLNDPHCTLTTIGRYFTDGVDIFRGLACEVRTMYETYIDVGFTQEQALSLVAPYIQVAFEKQAKNLYSNRPPKSKDHIRKILQEKIAAAAAAKEKEKEND